MSSLEILSLVITVVCLACFCCAFTFLFRHYYRTETQHVRDGREDAALLEDLYDVEEKKADKRKKTLSTIGKIVGDVVVLVVAAFFVFVLVSRFTSGALFLGDKASLVIATGSMSERNEKNDYLFDNGLENQFDAYDIVQIERYKSPDDVKLYDVVAYKDKDGDIIVHRIIQIEDGGYVTRGDANAVSDTGVTYDGLLSYDDILGYYTGERIPGIGAIVIFLQSNAGIITIVSILYCFGMFSYLSSRYEKALRERKDYLLANVAFDRADRDSAEKATATFDETLTYKDRDYFLTPTTEKKKGGTKDVADTSKEGEEK